MRYSFGPFVLDVPQRRLFTGHQDVRLQPKAFELLRLLVEAAPRVLSKDEILAAVWPDTFVTENSLATVIRDLRAALDDDPQLPRYIRTAYGFGYGFVGDLSPAAPARDAAPSGWRLVHDHREIRLREGDNLLGRSGDDVIVFDSPTVSRHHARIAVAGATATVEDLGSKNGTWVGTTRVTEPCALAHGIELRLGGVVAVVRYARRTPTTETARSGRAR